MVVISIGNPPWYYFLNRFGLHWRVDVHNNNIPEGYAIFDLPAFFMQIGVNLFERMNEDIYKLQGSSSSVQR